MEVEAKCKCHHCHGLGLDPDKGKRRQRGNAVTWTFKLKDDCPVCGGSGELQIERGSR
jgi:Zn finger protein HypA/HybF involved in hydrogenase expression